MNRRKEERLATQRLVHVEQSDDGAMIDCATGRTADVSGHGMRIELDHALAPRAEVNVALRISANDLIDLKGRVRSLQVDAERCRMGIEFVDLTKKQQEALLHLLRLEEN